MVHDYSNTTLHVSRGKEHYQPMPYTGIDIGPFSMDVLIGEGETPMDAYRRGMDLLELMAKTDLATRMAPFKRNVVAHQAI